MKNTLTAFALAATAAFSTVAHAGGPVIVEGEGAVINDTVAALPPASSFGLGGAAIIIPIVIVAAVAAGSNNNSGSH